MLNASSRRIISVMVFICFLKLILWVIFVNSLMFGTFFLKINKSLLNQEFGGKKTWFFIFVFYNYLLQILCFAATSTKPLEYIKYIFLGV